MFSALFVLPSEQVVYHGPPPWWPIFPIFWLLVIGLVVFFVVRRRRWGGCGYGYGRSGLDRLAERYAAGEIDETEYRSRREVLEEQYQQRR